MGRRRQGPSLGVRLVERFLLPILGPAQVGDPGAPHRAPGDEALAREAALHSELVRVVGPDGRAYMVEAPAARDRPSTAAPDGHR